MEFIGTCVSLPVRELDSYDDSEREISYSTFLKHVGKETVKELNDCFGVPIGKDWSVSFGKGKWENKVAYCMHHSGIHHIWVK